MSSLLRRDALGVAILRDRDRPDLLRLVDRDPYVNAVVASRLRALGTIETRRFGGVLLGVRGTSGELVAAAFNGGNLLPIGGGPEGWRAIGDHLLSVGRLCTSIVGRVEAVAALWPRLESEWGPPRARRAVQPLLVLDHDHRLPPGDPRLRVIRPAEVETYVRAAAAMFTSELGVSPHDLVPAGEYRRRVAGLIGEGRAFGILDEAGSVLFKADIGAVSAHTCQVQGVWVRPDRRGCGLGTAALAGVLRYALTLAPTVSLYVNDFNAPARRMYARLGMRQVATLSTVLF